MMSETYILLLLLTLTTAEKKGPCNGFQANLNLKNIIGSWQVVALIPEKLFPDKQVSCFQVEFSETDEAGLRWLVNKTQSFKKGNQVEDIHGPIVRQRYHSDVPFDVWSQAVEGVNGCFKQVLSLNTDKNDIFEAVTHKAVMQLHVVNSVDGSGPFLVQMLWGKMISAVIYRREQGITQDELKPVFELMSKLRGPQRIPQICNVRLHELHVLNN